jgi:tetratricopeptide (TPR) repeat protein
MPRFGFRGAKKRSVITLADRARDAGQWELAAGFYREALHRKPENPPIWVQYGHVLKEAGHLLEAETAYRRAIAYNENDADSYLQLGHVLKIQGKQEEAGAAYLRAFALDPSLDDAVFELAPFGWPKAYRSALLRGMLGREFTDAQTSSTMTGASLDRLAPVAPLAQSMEARGKLPLRDRSRRATSSPPMKTSR